MYTQVRPTDPISITDIWKENPLGLYIKVNFPSYMQLAALLRLHAILAFLPLIVTWNSEIWSMISFEIYVGY